jgi:SAM-dependent methyltransferase
LNQTTIWLDQFKTVKSTVDMLVDNNLRYNDCPLCKSSSITKVGEISYSSPVYFSSNEISLTSQPEFWRCKCCKSGFIQNIVSEEMATFLYQTGVSDERWSRVPFEEIKTSLVVKVLNQLLVPSQSVLDIGCNTGEFLDFAKARGCKTSGVEYSLSSLKVLQEKQHGAFQDIQEVTGYYDLITAFDVVEHLYDLSGFIKCCFEKLTSNGRLVFLTGDLSSINAKLASSNWWYLGFPEHIVFPSKVYFNRLPNLQLEGWYFTYAAVHYQHPISEAFQNLLKSFKKAVKRQMRSFKYTGYPPLGGDHVLIVLKKVEQA